MTVVKSKFVPLQLAHYCTHQLVPSKDSIQQSSRLSEGDCCHAWNNKVCCCSSYFTISKGQLILAPMHQTVYCSNLRLCWNHFAHDDAPKFPASTALKKKAYVATTTAWTNKWNKACSYGFKFNLQLQCWIRPTWRDHMAAVILQLACTSLQLMLSNVSFLLKTMSPLPLTQPVPLISIFHHWYALHS